MPPDAPGKVLTLDLKFSDGILIGEGDLIVPSGNNLRVSWYAENVPKNYKPICEIYTCS